MIIYQKILQKFQIIFSTLLETIMLIPLLFLFAVQAIAFVPCPRYASGSELTLTPSLFSVNGFLQVSLTYLNRTDDDGNQYFCYMMDDGINQSPTMRVFPGDHILITLKNNLPDLGPIDMGMMGDMMSCTSTMNMTKSSTNIHFHGIHTTPACHSDQVIYTIVNPGDTFIYDVPIPMNQPPGLYWYHPHIHGISKLAVIGGATGAIIIEGIADLVPKLDNLIEQIIVFRDTFTPAVVDDYAPAWDLTLNYSPIMYKNSSYIPTMNVLPNTLQFWRILNSCGVSLMNITLEFDGVPQDFDIVALDGVATGSHFSTSDLHRKWILISTGGRVEAIIRTPAVGVNAYLVTNFVDTGPSGDHDPTRRVLHLIPNVATDTSKHVVMHSEMNDMHPMPMRIPTDLLTYSVTDLMHKYPVYKTRYFFFNEIPDVDYGTENPDTAFFIVERGHPQVVFDMSGPAVTTYQGEILCFF